jgi:hypothetical protein
VIVTGIRKWSEKDKMNVEHKADIKSAAFPKTDM